MWGPGTDEEVRCNPWPCQTSGYDAILFSDLWPVWPQTEVRSFSSVKPGLGVGRF